MLAGMLPTGQTNFNSFAGKYRGSLSRRSCGIPVGFEQTGTCCKAVYQNQLDVSPIRDPMMLNLRGSSQPQDVRAQIVIWPLSPID